MDKVTLTELTSPEVCELLSSGAVDTAVIAVGATEQHGLHLPLGTDGMLAQALGEAVARRLGRALMAPPIVVGRSEHHMAFAGSMTFRQETLGAVVADYVASLARHGFKNVVIVASHGGNFRPLAAIAAELRAANPQVNIVDYTDLDRFIGVCYAASGEFGVSPAVAGGHSGESETSLMLALRPELVHMDRAAAGYVGDQEDLAPTLFAKGMAAISPNGVLGDPRPATAEKGRVYIDRLLDDIVAYVGPRLR